MQRRGMAWTAPHPCLIVRQVPSGNRRLRKTESAPAPVSPATSRHRSERISILAKKEQPGVSDPAFTGLRYHCFRNINLGRQKEGSDALVSTQFLQPTWRGRITGGHGEGSGGARGCAARPSAKAARQGRGTAPGAGRLNLNVASVETTWVNVPMRPVPARRMFAENYEWKYFQIHKVKLACGVEGFGETMPFYTWGRSRRRPLLTRMGETRRN